MNANMFGRSRRAAAFTLVELLVVIGIIALLISILIPTLSRARKAAITTKCAAQLHNNGAALMNYAANFRGAFPQGYGGGNWPWDVPQPVRELLLRYGTTREALFCPANPEQNTEDVWNYAVRGFTKGVRTTPENAITPPHNTKPPYATDDFAVIGYWMLTQRIDGNGYIRPIGDPASSNYNVNAAKAFNEMGMPVLFPDRLGKKNSAQLELMADATVSTGLPNNSSNTFTLVIGGSDTRHSSPHIARNGRDPEGSNVLFMDGHVAFKTYKAEANALSAWGGNKVNTMKSRRASNIINPYGGGGTDPSGKNVTFWW